MWKTLLRFCERLKWVLLLAKGSWAPIIEAFAELTGISTHALFGLCGSSYVILNIPQCLNLLKSCISGHERPTAGWAQVAPHVCAQFKQIQAKNKNKKTKLCELKIC